ncbi:MAG TPA: hypothetical protein VF516_00265 [Kofleriaceae bacterium]
MTTTPSILPTWPEPDADGAALDLAEVATTLGLSTSAVEVQLKRTRAGTARVAFPEPRGSAHREQPAPGGRPAYARRFWRAADIERYAAERKRGGQRGHRQIPAEEVHRIRRMHAVDGYGVNAIAERTGRTKASVSRILSGKTHREV